MDSKTFQNVNETANSYIGTGKYIWVGFEKIGNGWKLVSDNAASIQFQPWGTQWDSNSEPYLFFSTGSNYWEPEGETVGDKNPSVCELSTIL